MRIVLLLLLTALISLSNGQSDNHALLSQEMQTPLVFNQNEFGDSLSVLVFSDDSYDYYALDLTKLGGEFERVYFMNLSYEDPRVVNLDADLKKDQTWFKAYYKYPQSDIICLFKELKEKTDKRSLDMNDEEKSAWMAKNDKFFKVKNDE